MGSPAANAITFFETNRRTGYSPQFSLRVQQKLQLRLEMMQARSGQAQRPFPQFSKFGVSFPGSKGRRFLTGGFGGKVFGAWTIGAVMLLQSGPPILVATQQSRSGADSRTPGEQSKHVVDSNVSLSEALPAAVPRGGVLIWPTMQTLGRRAGCSRAPGSALSLRRGRRGRFKWGCD